MHPTCRFTNRRCQLLLNDLGPAGHKTADQLVQIVRKKMEQSDTAAWCSAPYRRLSGS